MHTGSFQAQFIHYRVLHNSVLEPYPLRTVINFQLSFAIFGQQLMDLLDGSQHCLSQLAFAPGMREYLLLSSTVGYAGVLSSTVHHGICRQTFHHRGTSTWRLVSHLHRELCYRPAAGIHGYVEMLGTWSSPLFFFLFFSMMSTTTYCSLSLK